MRYAAFFTLLALAQTALALSRGGAFWLLLWPGLSFAIVGAAYALQKPSLLGKRRDGTLFPPAVVLLLPYFLFTWLVWHLQTRLTREPPFSEAAPGLWLGRRPAGDALPPGVAFVLDLTAEFPESRAVRFLPGYFCLPILDAAAPSKAALSQAVAAATAQTGGVLVHCALGHGRSATAAILMAQRRAANAEDAERQVKTARPSVKLSDEQRALLRQWAEKSRLAGTQNSLALLDNLTA